jgi:uncharacterized delta-60 repeat protein
MQTAITRSQFISRSIRFIGNKRNFEIYQSSVTPWFIAVLFVEERCKAPLQTFEADVRLGYSLTLNTHSLRKMIMSNKSAAGDVNVGHHAGDRDVNFAEDGVIRSVTRTFAADPTTAIEQKFYMSLTVKPIGTDASELFRYNADGTMDHDFPRVQITAINEEMSAVIDIQRLIFSQPKGKSGAASTAGTITCVGVTRALVRTGDEGSTGIYYYPAAVRITAEGKMDQTFGTKGVMLYKFGKERDGSGNKPDEQSAPFNSYPGTLQSGGDSLFCCGLLDQKVNRYAFALVKFKNDGLPDLSYGDRGVNVIAKATDSNAAHWKDYGVDAAGDLTLVGATSTWDAGIVTRYGADGEVDTTYGPNHDGTQTLKINGLNSYINQIHVSEEGATTLLFAVDSLDTPVAVVRLVKSGEQDPQFNDGKPVLIGDIEKDNVRLAVDRNERIVVSGESLTSPGVARVVRLASNGTPDTSFGNSGVNEYPTLTPFSRVVIQNQSDILAVTVDRTWVDVPVIVRLFGESVEG